MGGEKEIKFLFFKKSRFLRITQDSYPYTVRHVGFLKSLNPEQYLSACPVPSIAFSGWKPPNETPLWLSCTKFLRAAPEPASGSNFPGEEKEARGLLQAPRGETDSLVLDLGLCSAEEQPGAPCGWGLSARGRNDIGT